MNFGDSVQDASRSGPLQDIQDLIDRLAAVTQQLRHPGRRSDGAPEASVLGRETPQQACAVGGTEGGRAQ